MIRSNELADFVARKPLGPAEVEDAAFTDDFPNRPRGNFRRDGTAEFVFEKVQRTTGFERLAHFFVKGAVTGWRMAGIERSANDRLVCIGKDNFFRIHL